MPLTKKIRVEGSQDHNKVDQTDWMDIWWLGEGDAPPKKLYYNDDDDDESELP